MRIASATQEAAEQRVPVGCAVLPTRLEQGDSRAGLGQVRRRGCADDPAADHDTSGAGVGPGTGVGLPVGLGGQLETALLDDDDLGVVQPGRFETGLDVAHMNSLPMPDPAPLTRVILSVPLSSTADTIEVPKSLLISGSPPRRPTSAATGTTGIRGRTAAGRGQEPGADGEDRQPSGTAGHGRARCCGGGHRRLLHA